ncbi:MAG TPA: adenylosuccinate synthetase [Candidatus Nanoarchaeia archaeon]|nr:adenylosuccinate synthetase [Candidatus Nanoarchaeia archaeon]
MGKTIVIVGGQWGDEGKGKIVDFLTEKADIIARYAGGNNAGHTVVVGKEVYKFHLIPSGIIHPGKLNVIGNGTVIDPEVLTNEITELQKRGFSITERNLAISSNAHIIQKRHIEEDKETGSTVGTTGRGIGPCYKDKIARIGMRVAGYVGKNPGILQPLVKDTYLLLNEALGKKNVLIEGAQGSLLDVDHGTYPFVTSSNPIAGGACTGLGIGPTKIDAVIGISKAYITRVGRGPFPTEQGSDQQTIDEKREDPLTSADVEKANRGDAYATGKVLRKQGGEYGTTTQRARRTGWFDAVAAKYAIAINGMDAMVITKLDVLSKLKTLKVCTSYEINGKKTDLFPLQADILEKAKPIYEELPGWDDDLSKVTAFKDLPANAQRYIMFLEKKLGISICIVSVGQRRDQTIVRRNEFLF